MRIVAKTSPSSFDALKWTLIVVLLVAGIVANTYFSQVAWALRATAGIFLVAAILLVAIRTAAGRLAWSFAKSARQELRKVVWPTRQETVQTTLVVVVMVIIAALILWGLDKLFFWLIGWLTGVNA